MATPVGSHDDESGITIDGGTEEVESAQRIKKLEEDLERLLQKAQTDAEKHRQKQQELTDKFNLVSRQKDELERRLSGQEDRDVPSTPMARESLSLTGSRLNVAQSEVWLPPVSPLLKRTSSRNPVPASSVSGYMIGNSREPCILQTPLFSCFQ